MDLLKDKAVWAWNQVQEEAFGNLKMALTSAPGTPDTRFFLPF